MDLTLFLKSFQFSRLLEALYLFKAQLHSLFHQILDRFMILTCFEFAFHTQSILEVREVVASSNLLKSDKLEILILLMVREISLINLDSSLPFFTMEYLNETIFSSAISIKTVNSA